MSTWVLFAVLFSIPFSLCAHNEEFASLETDSMFIVDGKVNAITGQFIDIETDLVIPSIAPINIRRHSKKIVLFKDRKWVGWHIDLAGFCVFAGAHGGTDISMVDDNGTPFKFNYLPVDYGKYVDPDLAKGVTNLGRKKVGGKTNLKNYKAKATKDCKTITIKMGSGETKSYIKAKDSLVFYPDRLNRPDGIAFTYTNIPFKQTTKTSVSPQGQAMGQITLTDVHSSNTAIAKASDGREVVYTFIRQNKKENYGLLASVVSSSKPPIQYTYDDQYRCSQKILPENRTVAYSYFNRGDTETFVLKKHGVELIKIDSDKDLPLKANRVKTVTQPADNNKNIVSKTFSYSFNKKGGDFSDGLTEVVDCHDHKSCYFYNKDFRPTQLIHCIKSQPDIKYQFYWGDPNGHEDGCLTAKMVSAEKGLEYKAIVFEYDAEGNVTKESFIGNLTGNSSLKPTLNTFGKVDSSGTESYVKEFRFSNDGINNLTHELHENGLQITYEYYPNTDLVKTRKQSGESIEHYLNYVYHPSGALESVKDKMGCVTRNTKYTPKLSEPCYGYPITIAETFSDKEIPLKTIHYTYNILGLPETIKVHDANGIMAYQELYEYNKLGCCTREVLRTKEEITRDYDANGNLLWEKGPQGLYKKTFTYDYMNRLTSETTALKDGSEYATRYQYNPKGALICTIDPYGNRTDYESDRYNRPTKILYPIVDGVQPYEIKEYDIFGNVTLFRDRKGYITTTTYNSYDKPIAIHYPDGSEEFFEYDKEGNLRVSVDMSRLRTEIVTDAWGRVREKAILDPRKPVKEIYHYDHSLLKEVIHYDQVSSIFTYDEAGRKISESTQGSLTTFEYDSMGRLYRTSHYDKGNVVSSDVQIFDVLDRVSEKWLEDGAGKVYCYERFGYDPLGNCNLEVKGGQSTTYEYDGLSRLIKKTDAEGHITTWSYDITKHQEKRTDPNGVVSCKTFDALNRLKSLEQRDGDDKKIAFITYEYDLNDNVIKESHELVGYEQEPYTVVREYDELNRLITLKEPKDKITKYTYTFLGQLKTLLKPDGMLLTYEYDARGNLEHLYSPDRAINYTHVCDVMGRLLSVSDDKTEVTRTYTLRGALKSDTYFGNTIHYDHDDLDRVTKITFPDNSLVEYEHHPLGIQLVKRKGSKHIYMEWDDFGNPTVEKLLDGSLRTKTFDNLNRLKSISHPNYSLQALNYDEMSNLKQVGNNTYSYDNLNQLTSESGTFNHQFAFDSVHNPRKKDLNSHKINPLNQVEQDGTFTYTYDLNGNLKTKSDGIDFWSFTYDPLDRLIAVNKNGTLYTYLYDGLHRRLCKESPTIRESYWYVGEKEVASISSGQVTSFRALGSGRGAEIGAAVLIEINGETSIPHFDQSGNLTHLAGQTVHYSAFGERDGDLPSPWYFASKRYDPETGFTFFGRRYYDPSLTRWISSDPLGYTAGINLYAYLSNNPLTRFDEYGLYSLDELGEDLCTVWGATRDFAYEIGSDIRDFACVVGDTVSDFFSDSSVREYSLGGMGDFAYNVLDHSLSHPLETFVPKNDLLFSSFGDLSHRDMIYCSTQAGLELGSFFVGGALAKSFKVFKESKIVSTIFEKEVRACVLGVMESRAVQLESHLDLNALSRSGQAMDRGGLTRAGRALEKHGGRPDSVFPKSVGNPLSKNTQGQFHLDDVLTHPYSERFSNRFGGYDIHAPDGRGVRFDGENQLMGFLQKRRN